MLNNIIKWLEKRAEAAKELAKEYKEKEAADKKEKNFLYGIGENFDHEAEQLKVWCEYLRTLKVKK